MFLFRTLTIKKIVLDIGYVFYFIHPHLILILYAIVGVVKYSLFSNIKVYKELHRNYDWTTQTKSIYVLVPESLFMLSKD